MYKYILTHTHVADFQSIIGSHSPKVPMDAAWKSLQELLGACGSRLAIWV